VGTVVVVIVAIVLCGLSNDCTNAGTGRAANNRALQTAAEDRTERSAAGPANQRTFTRPNATLLRLLVVVMIVMVRTIMAVVIIPAATAAAHSVVVSAIVVLLRKCRNDCGSEEERSDENSFSKLAHLRLDAKSVGEGIVTQCEFPTPRAMPAKKNLNRWQPKSATILTIESEAFVPLAHHNQDGYVDDHCNQERNPGNYPVRRRKTPLADRKE
jgi:hypothetical protein